MKHKCRERMPITSLSQDRRTGEYLSAVYNDESIHCYMCFVCGEKHLHLAGFDREGKPTKYKGSIEYQKVGSLMHENLMTDEKWKWNFDFETWKKRYAPKLQNAALEASRALVLEEFLETRRNRSAVLYLD